MIVADLLLPHRVRPPHLHAPVMDPLREEGALQEAQLLEVRLDGLHSVVGLLFEMRTALQLREANTGILVVRDVNALMWSVEQRATLRTAWTVVGSAPQVVGNFRMVLSFSPYARLEVVGGRADFLTGDVVGLTEAPPNYDHDDVATVMSNVAGWGSVIELVAATASW